MILETTQLLWCAHHERQPEGWQEQVPAPIKVYRKTHVNHPMAIWVRKDARNYRWTASLGQALCREYTKRYHKQHACETALTWLAGHAPFDQEAKEEEPSTKKRTKTWALAPVPGLTAVPLCMDEEYYLKDEQGDWDLVASYRNYYCQGKADLATWKYSDEPDWWAPGKALCDKTGTDIT